MQALALQAARAAIADAGLKPREIDAILPYVLGPTSDEMAAQLGISDLRYSSIIKMGGATFVACLETAALLIHTGIARNVLVFCARNGRSGTRVTGRVNTIPGQSFRRDFENPYGLSVPGQWYAMIARRHMIEFGTTREDAGHFAVAMRKHANLNPNAMMRDVRCRWTTTWTSQADLRSVPSARLLPGIGRRRRLHRLVRGAGQGHAEQAGVHQRRRAGQAGVLGRPVQSPRHVRDRPDQGGAARLRHGRT